MRTTLGFIAFNPAYCTVLKVAAQKDDSRSHWLQNLCGRRNKNIAVVALANKNTRIAWALLSKETDYLPEGEPA